MKLHLTSGYHPEGDGQMERTNQTPEEYLWIYCNYKQDNWSELLPLAEFAYNNAPSTTTGISPFFANKGYNPNISIHPERDLASTQAQDFVVNLDELHQMLKTEIAAAQKCYQVSGDSRHISPPTIQVRDQVFVKAQFFKTTCPLKKLTDKYAGLYEVIAHPGTLSFTLKLPSMLCSVHLVFHVSMLEPATPNTISDRVQEAPPLVEVDSETKFKIGEIVDSKIDKRCHCKLLYMVRWLVYKDTDKKFTWLPADKLPHASELVSDFHSNYPSKPGPDY